jgi:putative chitobiose transport system substrate-binding protein
MGEKIRKIGKYIFMPNFGDTGKFLEFMVQEGIQLLDESNKKAIFYNKKSVEFLKFWINLSNQNIIPKDSITQGHREAIDRFQAGETAVLVSGPQFLNIIKQNNPNLYSKIFVSKQLTGKANKFGVSIMNFVIPSASKKKEKAIKFAEFITNKENQLEFTKIANILPSIKSALDDNYFKESKENKNIDNLARIISAEQLLKANVLLPNIKKWSKLSKTFDKYFQMAFIGQIEPEEALRKANDEWNKILND